MVAKFIKSGDSQAVIIPKHMLNKAGITKAVKIIAKDGVIIITKRDS